MATQICEDVFSDLHTGDTPLKLRALKSLQSCAPVLRCDSLAQKIWYPQLNLQSQNISDRIVASVGSLTLGQQVSANCEDIAMALNGKPTLNDEATDKLKDIRGMCEAAIKGASIMSSWDDVKGCLWFLSCDDVFVGPRTRACFFRQGL